MKECDVIFHLAGMNRHEDPELICSTNIALVEKLIGSLERTLSRPHLVFASSTQEDLDNPYGRSKREGSALFDAWARKNDARLTCFVIPNVFGPFGRPNYNSVVATFCHKLTHNETPEIKIDSKVKLIYVAELIERFLDVIVSDAAEQVNVIRLEHTAVITVSELLEKLFAFKKGYYANGVFPVLSDRFERNLFLTFLCYIDHAAFYPFHLTKRSDDRGTFVETVRTGSGGQVSFSTTRPGVTRGNHFHTRKAERFAVIKGKALIELRRVGTEHVMRFELDGDAPSFVDMPIWHTHNIKNVGTEDLYTMFWINDFFDKDDPDTYFEEV